MSSLRFRALIVLAIGCAACASAPPPVETPVACAPRVPRIEVAGGERLNARPGVDGLPVQLRLYQLASNATLEQASFDQLWIDDASILGETLIERRELTVYPESRQELSWPAKEQVELLAAVALFREPRGRDWTMSFSLSAPHPSRACPDARPLIRLWLDGMKIRDGAGRPEATR